MIMSLVLIKQNKRCNIQQVKQIILYFEILIIINNQPMPDTQSLDDPGLPGWLLRIMMRKNIRIRKPGA
jgi:hypothetical protein